MRLCLCADRLALWHTPEQRCLRVHTNTLCFRWGPASSAAPLCSQFLFQQWKLIWLKSKDPLAKVLLLFVWEESNKSCHRKNSDSIDLPAPSVSLFSPSAAFSCSRILHTHTHTHTPVAVRLTTTHGNLFPNVASCRTADEAGALLPSVEHWCIITEEVVFHLKIPLMAAADSLTWRLFEVKIWQPLRLVSPPWWQPLFGRKIGDWIRVCFSLTLSLS